MRENARSFTASMLAHVPCRETPPKPRPMLAACRIDDTDADAHDAQTPPMPYRCRCWPRAALMDVDDADAGAGPRAASMDAADAEGVTGHVPHSLMDVVDADGLTTPTPTSCRTRSHR